MSQPWTLSLLPSLIPALLAVSAICIKRTASSGTDRYIAFTIRMTVMFCVSASLVSLGWLIVHLLSVTVPPEGQLISVTPLRAIMLSLVLGLSAVLLQFSRHYLAGESCYGWYYRWLLLTVAAVCLTVMANHLLLFVLGWTSVSVCLHQLLTLYPERPRAILAAHKKFIVARVAETCVLSAAILLFVAHDSFYIDDILRVISQSSGLSWLEQTAALLLGIAALIKCAQLPLHGWLIKVVEVPTPVSALLHAGVINLGGFMLLLFAPLFARAELAQWWVLIVAGISTVLSALIMTTRVSIKVRLAWSTSAQMGLMLMEIALGLYELALLHLIAHSLYKAHAFLNSGSAVNAWLAHQLYAPVRSGWFLRSAVGATALLCVSAAVLMTENDSLLSPWLLLATGLLALTANPVGKTAWQSFIVIAPRMLVLTLSYVLLKTATAQLPEFESLAGVSALQVRLSAADLFAAALFLMLPVLSWMLVHKAGHPAIQRLSALLFAGLYLDEWFTRVTLWLWPVVLPRMQNSRSQQLTSNSVFPDLSAQES